MYVYVCVYIYIYTCIYIYTYRTRWAAPHQERGPVVLTHGAVPAASPPPPTYLGQSAAPEASIAPSPPPHSKRPRPRVVSSHPALSLTCLDPTTASLSSLFCVAFTLNYSVVFCSHARRPPRGFEGLLRVHPWCPSLPVARTGASRACPFPAVCWWH